MNWGRLFRSFYRANGTLPTELAGLTLEQVRMLAEHDDEDGPPTDRPDDWSQFGLTRKGNHLYGPDEALEAYMAYREKQQERKT